MSAWPGDDPDFYYDSDFYSDSDSELPPTLELSDSEDCLKKTVDYVFSDDEETPPVWTPCLYPKKEGQLETKEDGRDGGSRSETGVFRVDPHPVCKRGVEVSRHSS